MTKEEIIAAVKECATKLGRAPSLGALCKSLGITQKLVRKLFGTYQQLLQETGLEGRGGGHTVSMRSLFLDWAGLARRLKRIPTTTDYEFHGKYSVQPLHRRFGKWIHIPEAMADYIHQEGLGDEWQDVMELIAAHVPRGARRARMASASLASRPRVLTGQPTYGQPLVCSPVTYAPTNEAGVVFLFGSVARDLGFAVMRLQTEFPDCEAMREMEPNRWQRVRIEFEYESRNFLMHLHPAEQCDLIVCWTHNWPECPLEVLELQRVVPGQGSSDGNRQ